MALWIWTLSLSCSCQGAELDWWEWDSVTVILRLSLRLKSLGFPALGLISAIVSVSVCEGSASLNCYGLPVKRPDWMRARETAYFDWLSGYIKLSPCVRGPSFYKLRPSQTPILSFSVKLG